MLRDTLFLKVLRASFGTRPFRLDCCYTTCLSHGAQVFINPFGRKVTMSTFEEKCATIFANVLIIFEIYSEWTVNGTVIIRLQQISELQSSVFICLSKGGATLVKCWQQRSIVYCQ